MFDTVPLKYAILSLFGVTIPVVWPSLYPKPYPGIPYNEASVKRISGDIPNMVPVIQATNEFSDALFTVTTQKLGTPMAQLLFPGIRKPLIVLEDPWVIEDIIVRRNKEFDKTPMTIDLLSLIFPHGSLIQYNMPELKNQKPLWADVMGTDFLRRAAAPNIRKATLELLELWRLKASTVYKDQPFSVHDDFNNAALDLIWVAVVGEDPGVTRFEINKLRNQAAGNGMPDEPAPRGMFLKEEVAYISDTISRNPNSPSPKWAQKLETYTPRYRRFRATVATEIRRAMTKAVDRFRRLEMGHLEAGDFDTCMMDLVLRRQILEARKAGKEPTDPTKDQNMLDEMFFMLVGGHDSTANALTWFVKFMEAYPDVQRELRTIFRKGFAGSSLPSVDDILETEIPYLDGVCEEGLRLAGTAKANLRQAVADTVILGYRIPKESFNAFAIPSLAFGGGCRGCFGRKLAMMELRIVVVLLVLDLEFLELPEELKTMRASEKIFRQPEMPYAKTREL